MKTTLLFTLAFLALLPSAAIGGVVAANWTNGTSGTLNGVAFTFTAGSGLGNTDLSGSNYAAFPLSVNQQVVAYPSSSSWTVTFGQPVSDLLLYDVFWRGPECGTANCSYTFDAPFVIASGDGSPISVVGQTLIVPSSGGFGNGILRFSGSLSALNMSTNLPTNGSL